MSTNKEIATTILQQLGGNRFIAMTGAKNFLAVEAGLTFQIPQKNNINKVNITLDVDDTYRMTFYKFSMKNLTTKIIYTVGGVYFDQLQKIFTEQTGLETHL
jgi:hypothetical protein